MLKGDFPRLQQKWIREEPEGVASSADVSTGAYGDPLAEAARIALATALDYLTAHPEIALVRFVLFSRTAYRAYEAALNEFAPTDA